MGMLARKEMSRIRSNERHAREMRDAAIARIHKLSYCRTRKDGSRYLVPRKKELRGALRVAMAEAQSWAWLARPARYPAPPSLAYDPQFPKPRRERSKHARCASEIKRLEFWSGVLEARGDMTAAQRVQEYLIIARRRLRNMLAAGQSCTVKTVRRRYEQKHGPFGMTEPSYLQQLNAAFA
jgi:hypothetical protein